MKPFWKFLTVIFLLTTISLPIVYIIGKIGQTNFRIGLVISVILMVISSAAALPEK